MLKSFLFVVIVMPNSSRQLLKCVAALLKQEVLKQVQDDEATNLSKYYLERHAEFISATLEL